MRKSIISAAVALVLGLSSVTVNAGAVVGATEFTQIANMIQLVQSYVEQVQQTVHQFNQYKTMLQNLQRMTPSSMLGAASSALWRDQQMDKTFRDLRTIVVGGQNISYGLGNLDSSFRKVHPGYGGFSNTKFNQLYAGWSDNTLGAVKNSLAVIGAHSENFASEEQMMNELQQRSQSASGQLEALQAGQDISMAMVGQMQKLRQLQMAQMQSQNAYVAAEQGTKDAQRSAVDSIIGQSKPSKSFK